MAKIAASARPKKASDQPRNWWQYALIYPTLLVTLISAVPTWNDIAFEWWEKLESGSADVARAQHQFWQQNFLCTQSAFAWFEAENDVSIDGTICPSGDLFLRIRNGEQEMVHGIFLDQIIKDSQRATTSRLLDLIAAPAVARTIPVSDEDAISSLRALIGSERVAQARAQVECQAFVDDRTVVRRIRVGAQCYDEFIDTLTGNVTKKRPVNCVERCQDG